MWLEFAHRTNQLSYVIEVDSCLIKDILFLQEAFKKKKPRLCEGCGLNIPLKNYTEKVELAPGGRQLCNTCARVRITCCSVVFLLVYQHSRHECLRACYCLYFYSFCCLFQLTKLKQYCGICKKIWNRSDKGSWVRQSKSKLVLRFIYIC